MVERSSPDSATARDEIIERTNTLLSPDFIPDETAAFADEVLSIVLKYLKTVAWRRISDDGVETFWHSEVPQSSALCLLPSWNTRASQTATPRKWDEGEHEGCGIDSQRALERQSQPATPTGGESGEALRDQVFKTIEVLLADSINMDAEFRSFTAKQLQKALDCATPTAMAQSSADIESVLPPVQPVEMVDYSAGYKSPAPSMYRVMVDKYCVDFETETAANNVRNAILALVRGAAQPKQEPVEREFNLGAYIDDNTDDGR